MQQFIYLIPLLPFLGFALNGSLGKRLPKVMVGAIASLMVFVPFLISFMLFLQLDETHIRFSQTLFNWIGFDTLNINFALQVDALSVTMMMVITGIGTLIHIYSMGYMHDDDGYHKFFAYLNLFIFSMLLLVMGSNFLVMFFGWEGVGLCSYLLIGFWYTNRDYGKAARKAFIMNRIGDLGLLIGMFIIYEQFGSFDYDKVFETASAIGGSDMLTLATFCLFIGAMGKSAQIPLYTWLPDAMAGPTPVSALIHAATMVTAGIYMIVRCNVLFSMCPDTMHFIAIIGIATSLFAAIIGLRQNDIKKVLAYSTVSQLGLMFLAVGVGAYSSAMFHLITHAFFKALLFLAAGSVIHAMGGEQDIRKMGGLKGKIKITFMVFAIGTIAISGIPPFSGFFSKDEILAEVFMHNKLLWALAFISSMITGIYMFRLLFVTFFGKFRGTHEQEHHIHESPFTMLFPLIVLAILAVIGGFLNLPEFVGEHNAQNLHHFLQPILAGSAEVPNLLAPSMEYLLMSLAVAGALIIAAVTYVIYASRNSVPTEDENVHGLEKIVAQKFYVDEIYDMVFVKPIEMIGSFLSNIVESKIIDGAVNLTANATEFSGGMIRKIQSGNIEWYLTLMSIGMVLIFLFKVLF